MLYTERLKEQKFEGHMYTPFSHINYINKTSKIWGVNAEP